MNLTKEMQSALEADGEKLRQLTGEEHGPAFSYNMEALDWENACHELLWEKGQEDLFLAIQRRAIDLFVERMKSQNTFSTSNPDDPIF